VASALPLFGQLRASNCRAGRVTSEHQILELDKAAPEGRGSILHFGAQRNRLLNQRHRARKLSLRRQDVGQERLADHAPRGGWARRQQVQELLETPA